MHTKTYPAPGLIGLGFRLRLDWLVSVYAHVFILLSVVVVTVPRFFPMATAAQQHPKWRRPVGDSGQLTPGFQRSASAAVAVFVTKYVRITFIRKNSVRTAYSLREK